MSSVTPVPRSPPKTHPVVIDASFVVALCTKEPNRYTKTQTALQTRVANGCGLHAPHILVAEAAFVLCGKMQSGVLTSADHAAALLNLHALLGIMDFPMGGDAALLSRAELLRVGYGCSHSADGLYIALAETLAPSELLTFDAGQQRQAAIATHFTVTVLS